MQPPMIGSWTVRVEAVNPFTIHGDQYFELRAVRTNDTEGNVVLGFPTKGDPPLTLRAPGTHRPSEITLDDLALANH